jgi:hypothetical protein
MLAPPGRPQAPVAEPIVLVIAVALTACGLALVAYMFGGCGTAYCS